MKEKGLCLIEQPGIDWPKASDLENERHLTASVIILKCHLIYFVVCCYKEIWNRDMLSISCHDTSTPFPWEFSVSHLLELLPFVIGHNVMWQASCSALCTIIQYWKALNAVGMCFIALAVVAEIASVSLNLKEHKTPREKAEVMVCDLGSFSQELKLCVFSNKFAWMFRYWALLI